MPNLTDLPRRLTAPVERLRTKKHRSLPDIGLAVLMVGLIAFAVYQVVRHGAVGLNTLRTQEILDQSYVELELFLFRDEQVLYAPGGEVSLYEVRDGEKVSVGQSIGTAYSLRDAAPQPGADGEDSSPSAAELQARLNAYGARLSLYASLGGLGTPGDARAEAEAVDRAYLGFLEAVAAGDVAAAQGFSERMQEGLYRYDILTGAAGGSAATLRAERDALVAGLPAVGHIKADRGGYFYYDTDGYESVFPYQSAMTMTPAEFRAMTETPAAAIPEGVVGKLVYSARWYAAAYVALSDDAIEVFQQGILGGAAYTMLCGDGAGTTVTMQLERMVPDGDGVLLVFSSQDMPSGFDFPRTLRAETVSLQVSGYRIPEEAVVTIPVKGSDREIKGVYILVGNVVEFRKLRIRVKRDGYIIAETYEDVAALLASLTEEERAADAADGWAYLTLNDNIITGGSELYEGKVIG